MTRLDVVKFKPYAAKKRKKGRVTEGMVALDEREKIKEEKWKTACEKNR